MSIFQTDGPLLSKLNVLTDLVVLNLLTVLMCLPVLTAGASLSAMHKIVRDILHDRGEGIVRRFFSELRIRFGKGALIFLPMLLLLLIGMIEAGTLLLQETEIGAAYAYVLLAAVLFAVFLENTAIILLSYGSDSIADLASDTIRLSFGRFPKMLAAAFLMLLPFFLLLVVPALLPLFFLLGLTVPAAVSAAVYEPVMNALGRRAESTGEETGPERTGQEGPWRH